MGMRRTQLRGLPPEAHQFIDEHGERLAPTCPHCKRSFPLMSETIGEYEGMFGETYPLLRYTLKDGGVADEFVQTSTWSSGLVVFLGLKCPNDIVIGWPESVVDAT